MTPAPFTPTICGHAPHSRADDHASSPADSAVRIRCSLSPATQHHAPRPGRRRTARDIVQSPTCRLLRRRKEGASRDWTQRRSGPGQPGPSCHPGYATGRPTAAQTSARDLPATRRRGQGDTRTWRIQRSAPAGRSLRQRPTVPVIMLTAKDTDVDKAVALQLGADDYVTKPFSWREPAARIQTVLRRHGKPGNRRRQRLRRPRRRSPGCRRGSYATPRPWRLRPAGVTPPARPAPPPPARRLTLTLQGRPDPLIGMESRRPPIMRTGSRGHPYPIGPFMPGDYR
jgi:hypothetical protein